ncbi:hypothetical protein C8R47DRAFT_1133432 [Mycena vitilis]|nr:hypothetical protein C8R47DRAFT_1133432 [Mycena vitilis]
MRVHHGVVNQGTVTTIQPPELMRNVKDVLVGMDMEILVESNYKHRGIRAIQRSGGRSTLWRGVTAESTVWPTGVRYSHCGQAPLMTVGSWHLPGVAGCCEELAMDKCLCIV